MRDEFTGLLQQQWGELGFDIKVLESGDRLVLSSSDFKDTDKRVQCLAIVRSRRRIFEIGFRQIHLDGGGFFEFGQDYSLNCK